MNTRTIIILVVTLLIVVCKGVVHYFFFSSPSGQAWEQDWIGNPIGLTAMATVGAAVGTVSAVIVALPGIQIGIQAERYRSMEEHQAAQIRFNTELFPETALVTHWIYLSMGVIW
jgi:hypothetical protein